MQKKTKYKSSNNFRAAFSISVFLCILGAGINSLLFYKSFFRTLSKLNEEPIAQVSFKYKTASRRFLERPVWDRLKKLSDLYNGDTVHTSSGAEATITFIDGNTMLLSESTIAQIFYSEGGVASARLSGGQVTVDSSQSENGFSLDSDGFVLSLESGGKLSATSSESGVPGSGGNASGGAESSGSVQIISGNARLFASGGEEKTVQGGEAVSLSGGNSGEKITPALVSVSSPFRDEKIIYHTEGFCDVPFRWRTENLPPDATLALQIYSDRKMRNLLHEKDISGADGYSVPLGNGNYFWKITLSENGEEKSVSGKFSVYQSLPPVLIAPSENYSAGYGTKNPSVRFVWSESPFADYYELSVSMDEHFENPVSVQRVSQTSRTLQSLGEGNYFWRVRPFYKINGEGFSVSSATGAFRIEKQVSISPPVLLVPRNENLVNIDEIFGGTYFSWKRDREAAEYEFSANDSEDFSEPKVALFTEKNFISLQVSELFSSGKWFWSVRAKDSEGNFSPRSEIRSFFAVNGNSEIRTIEPSDGFVVAENLLPDTKFTWKKNLPQDLKTRINIATDSEMRNLVYSAEAPEFGISGIRLPEGEYFWNLSAGTESGSVYENRNIINPQENSSPDAALSENGNSLSSSSSSPAISSSVKSFSVAGLLDKTDLIQPVGRAVVRENEMYEFSWNEVQGADYYRIDVFRSSTGENVYSNNVYGTSVSVDMFSGEGFENRADYRYEVQARANAVPGIASRRTGKVAESYFNLVKLYPVEIVKPEKGTHFDGAQAILNPQSLVWQSSSEVRSAQVVVTKTDENPNLVVIKVPSDEEMRKEGGMKIAPNEVLLDNEDGLTEGRYEIVVLAETVDGFDISNTDEKYKGRFTVGAVPPLETALNLETNPPRLDAAYLSENARSGNIAVNFSWGKVNEATGYEIRVYRNSSGRQILRIESAENSYRLDFLELPLEQRKIFQNGTFRWSVSGIRRIDTDGDGVPDKIFQRSRESERKEFSVEVPEVKKTKAKGVSNPYGEK